MPSGYAEPSDLEIEPPPDPLLRPVWEDTDETDGVPGLGLRQDGPTPPSRAGNTAWLPGEAVFPLLAPLCDAQDALSRLDARVEAAPEPVRAGIVARMAWREAAGWLALAHAWADPRDLALRDLGLTGSYTNATMVGRAVRDMPNTYARRATRPWEDQDTDGLMAGDPAVSTALTFARLLQRLARTRDNPFANLETASATVNQFGGDMLDGTCFAHWRGEIMGLVGAASGAAGGAGEGGRPLPPALAAARAAERWMTAGIVELPNPLQALLAAAGLLVGTGALRTVIPPLWAAYPTIAQGDADALPRLRSDVAARLPKNPIAPGWLLAFLHLLAEGARIALRELDRLLSVAEQGRALSAGCDRRSRFSHALDAVLRAPVLTPKALAAELAVAPQTATSLLRELRGAKLVTEVTGRRSFRAFAVVA
jgi:hypothetical protein